MQSINAPITTPAQYEIRTIPQQTQIKQVQTSQIALSANVVQHLLQQSNLNTLSLLHHQQQQIRPTTLNPPALVPTSQPKKIIQLEHKPKQTKVVHQIVTTQPNLIVIPRANSPPINIISTSSANSVAVQNLLTANSVTTVNNQTMIQVAPKSSTAASKP